MYLKKKSGYKKNLPKIFLRDLKKSKEYCPFCEGKKIKNKLFEEIDNKNKSPLLRA